MNSVTDSAGNDKIDAAMEAVITARFRRLEREFYAAVGNGIAEKMTPAERRLARVALIFGYHEAIKDVGPGVWVRLLVAREQGL